MGFFGPLRREDVDVLRKGDEENGVPQPQKADW
jgi:hypothetical protein